MEKNGDLIRSMEQIGLKDKEAKVYLTLLELESSTAYEIAQHCDVKHPTVYVILDDLRQKGLVLKVPHAKKALFAARDLSEYLSEQRGKLIAVQAMLPRLNALASKSKPGVYFFTGMKGFAEALAYGRDSMRGKTFHSFYGNPQKINEEVRQLYDKWTSEMIAQDISFKIVMARGNEAEYYPELKKYNEAKDHVEIKYYGGAEKPSDISIEIAEKFVRIDDANNITATIIADKAAADAMRQIFNIVWQAN